MDTTTESLTLGATDEFGARHTVIAERDIIMFGPIPRLDRWRYRMEDGTTARRNEMDGSFWVGSTHLIPDDPMYPLDFCQV